MGKLQDFLDNNKPAVMFTMRRLFEIRLGNRAIELRLKKYEGVINE